MNIGLIKYYYWGSSFNQDTTGCHEVVSDKDIIVLNRVSYGSFC